MPAAIAKGVEAAKKHFFAVPRIGGTIPHPVQGEAAAGVVLLKPASPGTGVIAGGPVRAVLECAGIHDVLSKSLGSSNPINIVHATVAALKSLHRPEEIAARRGLPIEDVAPAAMLRARAAAAGARRRPSSRAGAADDRAEGHPDQVADRRHPGPAGDAALAGPASRIGDVVVKEDRPEIRGMVQAVATWSPSRRSTDMTEGSTPGGRAGLKVHHLRPAPGAHKPRPGSAGARAPRARRQVGAPRAPRPATRCRPASRAARCRCTCGLPKLKGSPTRFKTTYQVVNLDKLAALFPDGGDVDPEDLVGQGAVRKGQLVKVLGSGEAVEGLRVTAHAFSATAREKITAAGGTVTEL